MRTTLKSVAAPKNWPIKRKNSVFTFRPNPGAHPKTMCISLGTALKDILKMGDTGREIRRIIGQRIVFVDGRPTRDFKRAIGLMDVVSIPKIGQSWRVLLDSKNRITLVPIREDMAKWKLVRIENKTTIRKGRIQLNMHDGRNLLLEKNAHKTGDVLKISLPDQKIIEAYPFEKGNKALIVGGSHSGELVTIGQIQVTKECAPNKVSMNEGYATVQTNVFIVGKAKPEITLPEVKVA